MIETPNEQTNTFDFTCEYSSNLPELLSALNISIAFTSYQAGRLMVVRSDEKSIDVNYKDFPRPMGLCSTESGLTLGTFAQIINFHRADNLIDQLKAPLPSIQDDITAPRIHPKEQQEGDSAGAPEAVSEVDKKCCTQNS